MTDFVTERSPDEKSILESEAGDTITKRISVRKRKKSIDGARKLCYYNTWFCGRSFSQDNAAAGRTKSYATVAQLVEQLIRNQQVAGSSPASSSTSEQAIQLLAPIFYSVRARGFCCCPVDSAVPFYQKLILLFFEKEGICCGRCLPFWVETAIGFFALQRFSCTAEINAADAGMLAVAGGLNGVRCPVLGS